MSLIFALKSSSIISHLSALHAPESVIYIGPAAIQTTQLLAGLFPNRLTIIDGDAERCQSVSDQFAQQQNIQFESKNIYSSADNLPYYRVSLKAEGGLISSEQLTAFWQNITTTEHFEVETTTLPEIDSQSAKNADWLLIDELHGKEILEGGRGHFEQLSVIIVRCGDDQIEANTESDSGPGISKVSDVKQLLDEMGFLLVSQISTRHPRLPIQFFVRNWQDVGRSRQLELDELNASFASLRETTTRRIEELEREITDLQRTRTATAIEQRAQNEQAESSIMTLTSDNARLEEDIKRLKSEAHDREQALLKDIDEKNAALASQTSEITSTGQRLSSLEGQIIEKDRAHTERLDESQRNVDQLNQEKTDLLEKLSAVEALRSEKERAHAERFDQSQRTVDQLNHEKADLLEKLSAAEALRSEIEDVRDQLQLQAADHQKALKKQADTISAQQETIDALRNEEHSRFQQIKQMENSVLDAEKRQLLSEHNLADLQSQYKALSKVSAKQSDDLDKVAAHLRAAKEQLLNNNNNQKAE